MFWDKGRVSWELVKKNAQGDITYEFELKYILWEIKLAGYGVVRLKSVQAAVRLSMSMLYEIYIF